MIHPQNVQVVVMMGGLGTRLKDHTKECPKSLVDVCGRPFFDHQLDLLAAWGFKKFVFLIGYKADMIEEYYGDGSSRGISIVYSRDGEKLLGTGGAVRRALSFLEEDFLLIYGDSFMDIDYAETLYRYEKGKENGADMLMTVFYNNDRFDKSNVVMKDGEIKLYDKKNRTDDMQYIDYGVCMYRRSLFEAYDENEAFDIADIIHDLSIKGKITPQTVTKRFYEIGNPSSLAEFSGYVKHRFIESHPAVFVDRDGVINEIVWNDDIEQLDSPMDTQQFKFLPGVTDAIRLIKEKGYSVRMVEQLIKEYNEREANEGNFAEGKSKSAASKISEEYETIRKNLAELLGTKVKISCTQKGNGKITLEYADDAELKRIIAMISH